MYWGGGGVEFSHVSVFIRVLVKSLDFNPDPTKHPDPNPNPTKITKIRIRIRNHAFDPIVGDLSGIMQAQAILQNPLI